MDTPLYPDSAKKMKLPDTKVRGKSQKKESCFEDFDFF
jgi:hypothetical protein